MPELMTRIGQIVGIHTFKYDVYTNKDCRQLYRCGSSSCYQCPRCGQARSLNGSCCLLQRICGSPTLEKLLQYPSRREQPPPGEVHDVYDTEAWAATVQGSLLSEDARNVVFSFHQDGVQPFKHGRKLSLEPFTVSILNFPPWLRTIPGIGTFMVGLPKLPPGQDTGALHPFWEPFVDEVNYLYTHGMQTTDAATSYERFTLRAGVLCGPGGGIMDSRGWPKNNCIQGPGAISACFCCHNKGFKAPHMAKVVYPLFHCYLPRDATELRKRCSELNLPSRVSTPSALTVASVLDFTKDAVPPQKRDIGSTRDICIRQERSKLASRYSMGVAAADGIMGYSPLWNLRPHFAPTEVVYDFMHCLYGTFNDVLQLVNGSLPATKIDRILKYEREVNRRYQQCTSANVPFVMSDANLNVCFQRLQRLVSGAPTSWRGAKWQFALHKKQHSQPSPNTHDIHMFVGCIGAFALDGRLQQPYGGVLMGLLRAFSLVKVKAIAKPGVVSEFVPDQGEIRKNAIVAICNMVAHFPAWLLDHQWHQIMHILDNLPVHTLAMWAVERTNRFLSPLIHNRWVPSCARVVAYLLPCGVVPNRTW